MAGSSGKSGISRCLQAILPEPWLAVSVDTFVDAMPASMKALAGLEVLWVGVRCERAVAAGREMARGIGSRAWQPSRRMWFTRA